jgi:uncharacterized membrane protein
MKNVSFIMMLMVFMYAVACNHTQQQQEEKTDNIAQSEPQATGKPSSGKQANSMNSQSETMKARFKKVVPNTDGAIYVFVDEDGKEWKLWQIKETKGMEFARKAFPNRIYSGFDTQWFEVTWGKRMKSFNQGGGEYKEREVMAVLSVDEVKSEKEAAAAPAITFKDLQNAVFFGTEPFWTIKFRDDHMYYTSGPGEPEKKYNYLTKPHAETPVMAVSENEVQINVWPATNATDQYRWYIKIREEPCNDGMSENVYPYTIEITWEDVEEYGAGEIGKGCGRKVNKTVTIQEIQKSNKIGNIEVSKCMYEPRSEFNIGLKAEFHFKGYFTIDPMSDQLTFHITDERRPKINVKIEDFTRPLFNTLYFKNEPEIQNALGNEKLKQIRDGKKETATLAFKNYHMAGKIDGYGGAYADFVSIIN